MIPITDAMKTGKEPLRTFGDLMQFYQQKTVAPADGQTPPAAKPVAELPQPVAETAVEQSPPAVETPPAIENIAVVQLPAPADQQTSETDQPASMGGKGEE